MAEELQILDDMLEQMAVYWAPNPPGDDGEPNGYASPVEICCRWDEMNEMFLDRRTGDQQISRARVVVQTRLQELGYLWLSPILVEDHNPGDSISALTDSVNPNRNADAWVIRKFDRRPSSVGPEEVYMAAWL